MISSAASGVEKPPEMPSDHGWPAKSPCATADVASSAPQASASASSSARACRRAAAGDEHRALGAVEQRGELGHRAGSGAGARQVVRAGAGAGSAGAACTSSGRLSTTVRRWSRQVP